MFNLSTIKVVQEIPTVQVPGIGRFYKTPKGIEYPSVTTVLDKMMDKPWLEEWIEEVGTVEANRIKNQASLRGQVIHKLCENYILGLEAEEIKKAVMPVNFETFLKIKKVLDEHLGDIYGLETPLYSDYLKLGGRTDLVAKWLYRSDLKELTSKRAIVDFKTARWHKSEEDILAYFYQTALYAVLFEERTGLAIPKIVIVLAVDDEPECQVFVKDRDDYIFDAIELVKRYHEK